MLPFDDRMALRMDPSNRVADELRTNWIYNGNNVLLPVPAGPVDYPHSHAVTAELNILARALRA